MAAEPRHPLHHHIRHLHRRAVYHLRNGFVPHEGNDYHPHVLRRKSLHLTAVGLVAVKVVAVAFVSFYAGQAYVTSVTPAAIIVQTNQARQANKAGKLLENRLLSQAARAKAQDMITKGYFAHISPTKVTPWAWFKKAGYNYAFAGENLAIDYTSSEDIIAAWLNSPSHRANLLSTRFKDIGVAVASGKINGAQSTVVVQMFGAPAKPVVKRAASEPVQTPEPVATKTALSEQPVVPAQATPQTSPSVPIIESPAGGSVVRTGAPTVVGRAEPGSLLTMASNGTPIGSTTVPSDGVFSLTASHVLAEGTQVVQVTSTARGLSSVPAQLTFTVDTLIPTIDEQTSFALPSLVAGESYDLSIVAGTDIVGMTARSGATSISLRRVGTRFVGRMPINAVGATAGSVRLEYADAAGNAVVHPLLDNDRFLIGVAAAPAGPATQALQVIFFSRAFLAAFFALLFTIGAMNVSMNWRRHHHPALLGVVLLLYGAGALMIF